MGINEKAWHVGFKWTIGNEDVPAGAIAVDNNSKQLHICDIDDVGTDWARATASHPELYIHSATTPESKYIKMYHDGTNGFINCDNVNVISLTATTVDINVAATVTGDLDIDTGDVSIDNGYGFVVGGTTQQGISDGGGSTGVTPEVQFVGTAQADSTLLIGHWNTTNSAGPMLAFLKSGNAAIGSKTAVASGEYLGRIVAFGDDATDYLSPAAEIRFVGDGTVATGYMPGAIEFYTTPASSETLTKAVTIDKAQHVTFVGDIIVDATTASESTATGSIQTDGGLGVAGATYLGDNLFLASGKKIDFNGGGIAITHSPTDDKLAVATTWTTVGTTGRPFYVVLATEAKLGTYANAFKAQVECGASGGSSGLLSVACFEMKFPKIGDGNFSCLELEATTPADTFTGLQNQQAFIYCNATGTTVDALLDHISFVQFEAGITAASGNMVGEGYSTVRISFDLNMTTHRYIPLSTAEESFTTAYPIATTSTIISTCTTAGISCTASTLNADTGRIGKFVGSVINAAQGDGYGVFEMQANFSGTVPSGSTANAASFWINLAASTVTAGTLLCVQNNGIWAPSGLTLSTSNLIIGMRMHCEIVDGTQPERISCFSINVPANHITSLWQTNAIEDLNAISKKSGDGVAIPWLVTTGNGTIYYVNAYTT